MLPELIYPKKWLLNVPTCYPGRFSRGFDAVAPGLLVQGTFTQGYTICMGDCGQAIADLNHAVLVVGYGTEPGGTDFCPGKSGNWNRNSCDCADLVFPCLLLMRGGIFFFSSFFLDEDILCRPGIQALLNLR